MSEKITRRSFIKKSAALGIGSMVGSTMLPHITFGDDPVDIVVVKGSDYFTSTKIAVELLGGIGKYVPEKSKVAILANPQSNNPGTYTKPEIVKASIQLCKIAGAEEIGCIGWLPLRHWINTGIKKVIDEEGIDLVITDLRDESLFQPVPVPKGVALKKARIMKTFYEYDMYLIKHFTEKTGRCCWMILHIWISVLPI
jgi:uncharacterized protein (DUF362 family)